MIFLTFYTYIYILGIASSQLTFIFFRGVETTNQIMRLMFLVDRSLNKLEFGMMFLFPRES